MNRSVTPENYPQNSNKYYHILALVFIICLLVSNLGATKLVNLGGVDVPGGIILFPLLYVLNDILTEVYGFGASRRVIWMALICNLFASMILYFIVFLPPSFPWSNQEAFENIFSLSPMIFIASIVSYIMGETVNATIIASLKIRMQGRLFIFRAIFSTFIGASLETIIFCGLVFSNKIEGSQLMQMIGNMILIKVIYEIMIMPVTVKAINYLKTREGIDVFESPSFSGLLPRFK